MKYIYTALLIPVVCALAFMSGCDKKDNQILVKLDNKHTITVSDFNDRVSRLPERYQEVVDKNKKEFLDELIVDTLLYNAAMKKGLNKDKEVKDVIEEAKRKILIARLLKDEVEGDVEVTEIEITDYYKENKEKFAAPETLRASHILVRDEGEANDIQKKVAKGEDFEKLAEEYSVDPTSKIGGDIGYFAKGQLVPEFEEVCFDMKVGETSGVVKTRFGYHIIKLTEKKEPHIKELYEVEDSIKEALGRVKKKLLFSKYVESLKEKSQIIINDDLLTSISKNETPE